MKVAPKNNLKPLLNPILLNLSQWTKQIPQKLGKDKVKIQHKKLTLLKKQMKQKLFLKLM